MRFYILFVIVSLVACDEGSSDRDAGPAGACGEGAIPDLTAAPIPGSPFAQPVYVTQAPGRPDALFVVELEGRIRIVVGDAVSTFLDISDRVTAGGEQGLLGLAFDPEYATSGRFFVYYTPSAASENVIAEYHRSEDPNVAGTTEIARLWAIDDDEGNHNGGCLQFGPDGLLYAATGDGGGGGDQHGTIGNALDLTVELGKILRLDVDAPERGYAAEGNPFADTGSPLVWAYGLRNPWRFSFDRARGDLWIGDVGQNAYEEIDFRASDAPAGANFGWRAYEADTVFDEDTIELVPEHAAPVFVVPHSDGLLPGAYAIVGGYVYRGSEIPELAGTYLFGDNGSVEIGALRYCEGDEAPEATLVPGLAGLGRGLSSFGEDLDGELYLVYVGTGEVLRITAN